MYLESECSAIKSAKTDEKTGGKLSMRTSMHVTNNSKDTLCPICQGTHKVYNCSEFLNMTTKERSEAVKQKRLCYNCLKNDCNVAKCPSRTCSKCKGKHNT